MKPTCLKDVEEILNQTLKQIYDKAGLRVL